MLFSDGRKMYDAYAQKRQLINEGLFERLAARGAATGAAITQPFKNVGAGVKAFGHILKGDREGAARAADEMKSSKTAAITAKTEKICLHYMENMANDLVKLQLISPAQADDLKEVVKETMFDFIENHLVGKSSR